MFRTLSLLALLAACAPRPPVPVAQVPPPAYPAETRARLLRILDGEWREWGARVLDARAGPLGAVAEGPVAEQSPAAFPMVLAYWSAVGWQDSIDRTRRDVSLGQHASCTPAELAAGGRAVQWGCQPWSAAFLSFAMRVTGIAAADFPPAAAHWRYVDALIAAGDRWGARATFLGHEIEEYAPVPGDMICADRSGRGLTTLAARRTEGGAPRPMHCDIVVATAPGEVLALGGNVAQGVTAVRHATDAAGRLTRGGVAWFAVFENRMGRAAVARAVSAR